MREGIRDEVLRLRREVKVVDERLRRVEALKKGRHLMNGLFDHFEKVLEHGGKYEVLETEAAMVREFMAWINDEGMLE